MLISKILEVELENGKRIINKNKLQYESEFCYDRKCWKKINEYFNLKDVSKRNKILKELVFDYPKNAKDFFYKAFKKERYLDMKLTAVRGYAFYSSEDEVEILMSKLLDLLKKRPEHTPYNYQEYEIMRSKFLMPYLLENIIINVLRTLINN